MIPRGPHYFSSKQFICRSSPFTKRENKQESVSLLHFSTCNLKFLFITADVILRTLPQFRFVKNLKLTFKLIGFLWVSSAHKFSLARVASEAQKTLAKMEF